MTQIMKPVLFREAGFIFYVRPGSLNVVTLLPLIAGENNFRPAAAKMLLLFQYCKRLIVQRYRLVVSAFRLTYFKQCDSIPTLFRLKNPDIKRFKSS